MGDQRFLEAGRVQLSGARARALRDGAIVAGLLFFGYLFLVVAPQQQTVGFDALSYYLYSIDNPYWLAHGTMGSFVYSPIAARLFQFDALLPFWQFLWLWMALLVGTVLWLGGRRRWLWILAFPPVALELYHGNVHLLIAAAIALGVTAALVAVSLAFDFRLWQQWVERDLLVSFATPPSQPQIAIPLLIRLPAAAALVIWGARTDRKWTVPMAAALAMPVLWISAFAVLAALPALNRPELAERRDAAAARVAKQTAAATAAAATPQSSGLA